MKHKEKGYCKEIIEGKSSGTITNMNIAPAEQKFRTNIKATKTKPYDYDKKVMGHVKK
jgi:hypothetical protein